MWCRQRRLRSRMKEKFRDAYMKVAETFAGLSTARRLHVGAIIVKDDRIISIGYNGMPSGWTNECENIVQHSDDTITTVTKDEVIHAEANAIIKLARDGESGNGSSLFCTHAPCIHCAKLIHGAGIDKVYYRHSYRDEDGLSFLQKCKINVEKV